MTDKLYILHSWTDSSEKEFECMSESFDAIREYLKGYLVYGMNFYPNIDEFTGSGNIELVDELSGETITMYSISIIEKHKNLWF